MFAQGGGVGRKGNKPLMVEGLQDGGTPLLPLSCPSSGHRGGWGVRGSLGGGRRCYSLPHSGLPVSGAGSTLALWGPFLTPADSSLCVSLFRFQPKNSLFNHLPPGAQGRCTCQAASDSLKTSFIHLLIHLFIQNSCIEHQTCAGQYHGCWGHSREEHVWAVPSQGIQFSGVTSLQDSGNLQLLPW